MAKPGYTYKKNKYNAIRTEYAGVSYDSKAEARRAQYLHEIDPDAAVVMRQVKFPLGAQGDTLRVDFVVYGADKSLRAEDVKGYKTAEFLRKAKLWAQFGPCDLWILTWKSNRWEDEVIPGP